MSGDMGIKVGPSPSAEGEETAKKVAKKVIKKAKKAAKKEKK